MMEITKIFDKKKRDLSSKSNDGEDSKRPRESSLDEYIANATNTDVFTQSLKSEDCIAILYNSIKKLEEEMKFSSCLKKQNRVKLKAKTS